MVIGYVWMVMGMHLGDFRISIVHTSVQKLRVHPGCTFRLQGA